MTFPFQCEGWRYFEFHEGTLYAFHPERSTNWKLIPPWNVRQKFFEWLMEKIK